MEQKKYALLHKAIEEQLEGEIAPHAMFVDGQIYYADGTSNQENGESERDDSTVGRIREASELVSSPLKAAPVFRNFDEMFEIKAGMSNFDHTIDDDMEALLRAAPGKAYGGHAGWNFNGKVWFENGLFHEEVWRYCSPRETISADSLRELMDAVNESYGSE